MVQMSSQMVAQFRKECSQGVKVRRTHEQGHMDGFKQITTQYLIHQKVCMQLRFKHTHTHMQACMHARTHARTHAHTHIHTHVYIYIYHALQLYFDHALIHCFLGYVKTVPTVVIWGGGGDCCLFFLLREGQNQTNNSYYINSETV